jgi:hypothetical protein
LRRSSERLRKNHTSIRHFSQPRRHALPHGHQGNRDGAGAYTESSEEALKKLNRGDIFSDSGVKTDRSDAPNQKPYSSFHYPGKK